MSYENVKNYRQRLKERATYVLGNKCQCFGYDKCISALDFHHLNPDEKEFSFNDNTNRSWENTRKEIAKCILVCANCHREIHAGLIDNSLLQSSFDEERAKEIDCIVQNIKAKKIYYCKHCGAEVTEGNDCCPKCASIQRRVVDRPSREELKNLIRTIPFTKIGKKYGVSDNAVRKWCFSYQLPTKVSDIKQINDKDWELI